MKLRMRCFRLAGLVFFTVLFTAVAHAEVEVVLRGVEGELRDNVLAFLSIRTLDQGSSTDQASVSRAHEVAVTEIRQALQPFGYYSPEILSRLTQPEPEQWQASYEITPGPRVRWRKFNLIKTGDGRDLEALAQRLEVAPLETGQPLDHEAYSALKGDLVRIAYDRGYLDARFETAQLAVSATDLTADVHWVFNTGPRYYFGDVAVEQEILNQDFVNRYLSIAPGQVFSASQLIDLQLRLSDTNYFSTVEVDVERQLQQDQHIPIVVRTTPRARFKYSAGAGYGTDTGPRVSAGIENRRVNRRGHRYEISTRASQISQAIQAEYRIPIKNVSADQWLFSSHYERTEVGDAETDQFALGLAREDDWGVFRRRLFVNAERELFDFEGVATQSAVLVYPGITLSRDVLDNPQFVRQGYSVSATVFAGLESLGSEVDFLTTRISGRAILPLGSRARLLMGAELGKTESRDFSELPPSKRFYAGGDRSVRGYAFESIGPENARGDVTGGSFLVSTSVEVDYQIRNNYGVALFYDQGSATGGDEIDFQRGVGIGFRYRSPVGMIRVDLAHPLDDSDSDFRLHLSIGPDL